MAELFFGMNQSLDGYVDHDAFAPGPKLFQHFITQTSELTGSLYGRTMYEIMRYWDDEQPGWDDAEQAFAAAWRDTPKWVVSQTMTAVGPNATLLDDVTGDDALRAVAQRLKAEHDGEIEVAGPTLASSLSRLDLIDEYRIYLHPVVVASGTPYFAAPRPALQLISCEELAEDVLRLSYRPRREGR